MAARRQLEARAVSEAVNAMRKVRYSESLKEKEAVLADYKGDVRAHRASNASAGCSRVRRRLDRLGDVGALGGFFCKVSLGGRL